MLDHLRSGTVRPILVPNWIPAQIPQWETIGDAYTYAASARLPFDRLALDYGAGMDVSAGGTSARMTAAIIDRVGGALRITPTIRTAGGGVQGLMTTLWGPDSRGVPNTVAIDAEDMVVTCEGEEEEGPGQQQVFESGRWAMAMAAACAATLYLTEAMNVTFADVALTRQLRRNDDGTLCVPQQITIESRASSRVARTEGHSRLTMRHQVRGHYKHHPPGTPIYDHNRQEAVLDPVRGEVVRVWCPPYLAGPERAPLRAQIWTLPGYVETTAY